MSRPFLSSISSRRKAFSLLELLIVIVIIAQLAAILFPVFSRVRENARRSSCQSNMRQIGLGLMQYVQDYDDMLPLVGQNASSGHLNIFNPYDSNANATRIFKMEQSSLAPYVRDARIFICPSDTAGEPRKLTYAVNPCITNMVSVNDTICGRSMAYFEETSKWISLTEEAYRDTGTTDDGVLDFQYWGTNRFSPRHAEGGNNVFLDGHVKWLRPQATHAAGYLVGGKYATSSNSTTGCPT